MNIALERMEYQREHRSVRALIEVRDNDRKYLFQGVLVDGADEVVIRIPVHRRDLEAMRSAVSDFIAQNKLQEQMRQLLLQHAG